MDATIHLTLYVPVPGTVINHRHLFSQDDRPPSAVCHTAHAAGGGTRLLLFVGLVSLLARSSSELPDGFAQGSSYIGQFSGTEDYQGNQQHKD